MDDPDVFAYLFPAAGNAGVRARETIDMAENQSRYLPAQRGEPLDPKREAQGQFDGEATEESEDETYYLERLPCLALRFSNRPRTRLGLVAGRSSQADLVMDTVKGVSMYHFALTFDHQKQLVIRDLDSVTGTRVIYDGEKAQRGRGVTWSVCGPSMLKGKIPVLRVAPSLEFRIIMTHHDINSPVYLANVARFLEGTAAPEDLFLDMACTSHAATELPTGVDAHTPAAHKRERTLWKRELGRGSFGVVSYAWDVTTREEFALKEHLRGRSEDWRREAEMLKGISHVSTVPQIDALLAVLTSFYPGKYRYAKRGVF